MLTNKAIAVAALAALAEQATAFNSHRHLHNQIDKRALETEWTTVWETVYITAGDEIPAPTPDVPAEVVPTEPDVDAPPPPPAPTTSAITSTSTVVVAPTTEPAPVPAPIEGAPAPQLTTLVTAVKPPAEEPTPDVPAPVPEEADETEEPSVAPVLNPVEPEPTTTVEAPAPPAEETSTPNPPTNPPTGSPVSSKRGLAFNDATLANAFNSACESCSWAYNWDSSRGDLGEGIDFVPMLWNDQPLHTDRWEENCENELANGAKALFSFNEPDHATQANMSPEQAAASHIQWMNKYAGRALIGAPAITNSGNPGEGLEWLQGFVDACEASSEGCSFDFCNVHWYSEAQYADTLFEHLQKAHEICNKPVWLTEFAPLGSDDQISEFMTNIIPELDNVEYLEAYSYFMVSAGSLMSSSSSLSGYGQIYATV